MQQHCKPLVHLCGHPHVWLGHICLQSFALKLPLDAFQCLSVLMLPSMLSYNTHTKYSLLFHLVYHFSSCVVLPDNNCSTGYINLVTSGSNFLQTPGRIFIVSLNHVSSQIGCIEQNHKQGLH